MRYDDSAVSVDADGITIKRYGAFGSPRTIPFNAITSVAIAPLGSLGRWRLVGAGPGGGFRNWYGWDRYRRSREISYSFDVGRFWRPTVTPASAEAFRASLSPTLEID